MDDSSGAAPSEAPRVIAGFWRRVLGLFVDCLILGAVGIFLGFFLSPVFMQMGPWGRLVGFVTALLYFGLMNSEIFGGQTLGKRAAKTKVVNSSGEPLAYSKSLLRYAVLGIPFFLNNARVPLQILSSSIGTVFSVLIFGFGGSIIYLIIFNRRTRQSLHDVIAGSYVVKIDVPSSPITIKMWNGHYAVIALVLLTSAVLPNLFAAKLAGTELFKPLLVLQQKVMSEPEISYASVFEGQNWSSSGTATKKTTNLVITAFLKQTASGEDRLANKIAEIAFKNNPRAMQKDLVSVTLVCGYDIGIASFWARHPYNLSPQQWQERFSAQR